MSEKKKDLTISLLSSGRIDTIERCLSSLVPFKEQLDTEIIIVDTDPEHREDVQAILGKYTDQIIPFTWCDDFSAARNVGVDAAQGEWFLFIDDDEWYEEPQPLIDFLKSEEARNYSRVSHRILNYLGESKQKKQYAWVERLFRLEGGVRFHAKVHEFPSPQIGEVLVNDAVSAHDGYAYKSEEEKLSHAHRNIVLIEKMMEQEPQEVKWVYQLLVEYMAVGDEDRVISLAHKGYRMMEDKVGYMAACVRGYFVAALLILDAREGRWKACTETYKKYASKKREYGDVSRAFMEVIATQAYYHTGKTKNSGKHGAAYMKLYRMCKGKPIRLTEDYLDFLIETFDERVWGLVATLMILDDLSVGSWSAFDEYFDQMKWDGSAEYPVAEAAADFLRLLIDWDDVPKLAHMAGTFWNAGGMLRQLISQKILDLEKANDDRRWRLIEAVLASDLIENKPVDLVIVWDDHEGHRENMPAHFRQLFVMANPLVLDAKLWEIGLRRGAVLDERIAEIPFERWKICVDECMKDMNIEHIRKMSELMDEAYLGSVDEHYQYYKVKAKERSFHELEIEKEANELRQKAKIQTEMKHLIEAMQEKVEELIAAGMMDEAEEVMREIAKYTPGLGVGD